MLLICPVEPTRAANSRTVCGDGIIVIENLRNQEIQGIGL